MFFSGPANQNSQLWLSWSQQYNLEKLYRKYQIDYMSLLNRYNYNVFKSTRIGLLKIVLILPVLNIYIPIFLHLLWCLPQYLVTSVRKVVYTALSCQRIHIVGFRSDGVVVLYSVNKAFREEDNKSNAKIFRPNTRKTKKYRVRGIFVRFFETLEKLYLKFMQIHENQ